MALSTGTIRAVNPTALATVSGVTKIPGFSRLPYNPVVRPDLLTGQLMGMHMQCPRCCGSDAGPAGHTGFASFIPPDYGNLHPTLHGLSADGDYGIFKMVSSQSSLPSGPGGGGIPGGTGSSSLQGMGKGAVGNNAATSGSRYWSFGLRGMGKGAVGNNAATSGSRYWSFGLRGLAQDTTTQDQQAQDFQKTLNDLLAALHPGSSEADVIVQKAQNPLMANMGIITNQFLSSANPSVATLQSLYNSVANQWANFKAFVSSPQFTDRRASAQALNTVGPIIDGTCGYPARLPNGPVGPAPLSNCGHWGAGTLGGDGTNGMLGALQRAISGQGGAVPLGPLTAGLPSSLASIPLTTWLLIGLGVLVIARMK
jgi:hypothetical protein